MLATAAAGNCLPESNSKAPTGARGAGDKRERPLGGLLLLQPDNQPQSRHLKRAALASHKLAAGQLFRNGRYACARRKTRSQRHSTRDPPELSRRGRRATQSWPARAYRSQSVTLGGGGKGRAGGRQAAARASVMRNGGTAQYCGHHLVAHLAP